MTKVRRGLLVPTELRQLDVRVVCRRQMPANLILSTDDKKELVHQVAAGAEGSSDNNQQKMQGGFNEQVVEGEVIRDHNIVSDSKRTASTRLSTLSKGQPTASGGCRHFTCKQLWTRNRRHSKLFGNISWDYKPNRAWDDFEPVLSQNAHFL